MNKDSMILIENILQKYDRDLKDGEINPDAELIDCVANHYGISKDALMIKLVSQYVIGYLNCIRDLKQ